MKEFMFLIRSFGDPVAKMSLEQQQRHVQKVGAFIEGLAGKGILTDAQPLEMDGAIISGISNSLEDGLDCSGGWFSGRTRARNKPRPLV